MTDARTGKEAARWAIRSRTLVAAMLSIGLLSACADSPDQMLDSARSYLARDDVNAAEIQLKNALQKDGSLQEARFLLGRIHLEKGDVAGAVKELQRAFDLGYAKTAVVPLLAKAHLRTGDFDLVLNDFGDVRLDDEQAQATLLTAIAGAYFGKADLKKANELYEQALALNPGETDAAVGLSVARLFSGDPAGAEAAAREALVHDPDSAQAYAALSDALLVQNRQDDGIAALVDAVKHNPKQANYHYTLITTLFRSNRYEEGKEHFSAMKEAVPGHPMTRYIQAFLDVRDGRLTQARDMLAEVQKQAPGFLPAQLLSGSVLLQLNEQAQGREQLNAVLSRAPGNFLARALLISSHLSVGEAPRALELLQPILEQQLEDPRVLGLAGQVFLANGEFDRAEDYLQRAAAAAPENVQTRLRLGAARLAGGDTEGALADFGVASELNDQAIQADLATVATHLRRGELDKALAAQAEVERKQPDNPLVHTLRGSLMLASQDVPAARAAFEHALQLNPDFLAAALSLARLDLAERNSEQALARISAIADRNDKNMEARLALADLQQGIGAPPSQVLATLERAQSAAPGDLVPALAIIRHHLRHGDTKTALAAAQKLGSANADDVRVVEMLARAQLAAGDRQQAISSLNRLVNLRPLSVAPLVMLADVHRANNDPDAAEQALRKALGVKADAIEVQQRLAALLREKGNQKEALRVAQTVQQQHPGSPAGHVLEAELEAADGRWPQAASAYRQALDHNGAPALAPRLHASLERAGNKSDADRFVADWLQKEPQDLTMRGYLAERALAAGELQEAARIFHVMNELSPNNPLVLNNLAWTAGKLKDPKAEDYARQALSLAPNNAAVLDTLGVIQVESGKIEDGLANLERAVSIAPELPQLRLNLAQTYAKLGRTAEARKEAEAILTRVEEGTALHKSAQELLQTL